MYEEAGQKDERPREVETSSPSWGSNLFELDADLTNFQAFSEVEKACCISKIETTWLGNECGR